MSATVAIDAAELARLQRVDRLAREFARLHALVWPPTRMGEPDPGPRPAHATLSRAERALLDEVRKGRGT